MREDIKDQGRDDRSNSESEKDKKTSGANGYPRKDHAPRDRNMQERGTQGYTPRDRDSQNRDSQSKDSQGYGAQDRGSQGRDSQDRGSRDYPRKDYTPRDRNMQERGTQGYTPRDRDSQNRDSQGYGAKDYPKNDRSNSESERDSEGRRPFKSDRPMKSFEKDEVQELIQLDTKLLNLITHRTQLLDQLRSQKHLDPKAEKRLRISWENSTAKISHDVRLSKDMFTLMQQLEVLKASTLEQPPFNLQPALRPVDIDLPAPGNTRIALYYLALAGAKGQKASMENIALTNSLIDGLKSINQMGAKFWYEKNGSITSQESSGLESGSDKGVYIGTDSFNFYLCISMILGLPYHLKLSCAHSLHIDISDIRNFLPSLGARLAPVVASQDSLPVRIESSGMLPAEITIPENLPSEFVLSLMLASSLWDVDMSINLKEFLAKNTDEMFDYILEDLLEVLKNCGAKFEWNEGIFSIQKSQIIVPEEILVPSHPALSSMLFFLPALTGGQTKLTGVWTNKGEQKYIKEILDFADLEWNIDGAVAISSGKVGQVTNHKIPLTHKPLQALLWLYALSHKKNLPLPEDETHDLYSYLHHAGLEEHIPAEIRHTFEDVSTLAWLAPSPLWAVSLSFAGFLKPHLKLVNPNILNDYYPFYWRIYNTLPRPSLQKKIEAKNEEPTRRRIIAKGVLADIPELPAPNDDE